MLKRIWNAVVRFYMVRNGFGDGYIIERTVYGLLLQACF